MIQALSARVVTKLRAIVLLPTRDLALQVKSVFSSLCAPLSLRVEAVLGIITQIAQIIRIT